MGGTVDLPQGATPGWLGCPPAPPKYGSRHRADGQDPRRDPLQANAACFPYSTGLWKANRSYSCSDVANHRKESSRNFFHAV